MVYNPNSTSYRRVKKEVLDELSGVDFEKLRLSASDEFNVFSGEMVDFVVGGASIDENAAKLAEMLQDEDVVISAGGDGTGVMVTQALMGSGARNVVVAYLPYGNFNDIPASFPVGGVRNILVSVMAGRVVSAWPLQMRVNGEHYRYGLCYFTVGLLAEAVDEYEATMREDLKSGKKGWKRAVMMFYEWWKRNRKSGRLFLPVKFLLNGVEMENRTDYAAFNGRKAAKVLRGGKYYRGGNFLSVTADLKGWWKTVWFMGRAVVWRTPGKVSEGDRLEFINPAGVSVQGEGEVTKFVDVNNIEVGKANKMIRVVVK